MPLQFVHINKKININLTDFLKLMQVVKIIEFYCGHSALLNTLVHKQQYSRYGLKTGQLNLLLKTSKIDLLTEKHQWLRFSNVFSNFALISKKRSILQKMLQLVILIYFQKRNYVLQ